MHRCFTEISHESNESSVPFIGYFGESGRARSHEYLSASVLEFLDSFFVNLYECLGGDFFSIHVLKLPDTVFLRKLLLVGTKLWQNTYLD